MTDTVAIFRPSLRTLDRVREILRLVNSLREIQAPLSTADGLRQAIAVVLQFAELAGLDEAAAERLRSARDDEGLLNVVLAVARYVTGLLDREEQDALGISSTAGQRQVVLAAQDFSEWLPVIIQLIGLLRKLRGKPAAPPPSPAA